MHFLRSTRTPLKSHGGECVAFLCRVRRAKGCALEFGRDFASTFDFSSVCRRPSYESTRSSVKPGREMGRNLAPHPNSRKASKVAKVRRPFLRMAVFEYKRRIGPKLLPRHRL